MAVAHHLKPGLTDRTRAKIMTVDPATRRVEAALKDGTMVHIAVWDVPSAFRWPKENEVWIIRRDNGFWTLDRRQRFEKHDPLAITDLAQGEMVLDSDVIYDAAGKRLATVVPSRPALSFGGSLTATRASNGARRFLVGF